MRWTANRVAVHRAGLMAVGAAALLIADPGAPVRADEPRAPRTSDAEPQADAPSEPRATPVTPARNGADAAECTSIEIEAGRWWVPSEGGGESPLEPRSALPCRVPVPSAPEAPVRVTHVDRSGEHTTIDRVERCGQGGGFVVRNDGEARLCPQTCRALEGKPDSRIVVARGCAGPTR